MAYRELTLIGTEPLRIHRDTLPSKYVSFLVSADGALTITPQTGFGVTFPAGTVSVAAVAIGTVNTGLYAPGGGILGFAAGGVEVGRMINGITLFGTSTTTNAASGDVRMTGGLWIGDGITAPTAQTGFAVIYVDSADGDLKVKFADGVTKTLAADT